MASMCINHTCAASESSCSITIKSFSTCIVFVNLQVTMARSCP
jgi:hypothetical protein